MFGRVAVDIVDTPATPSFGGEVERVLKMVNGVCCWSTLPRAACPRPVLFCRRLSSETCLLVITVDGIDRPNARIAEVIDEILELLMDLGASTSRWTARWSSASAVTAPPAMTGPILSSGTNLEPLFDTILKYVPPAEGALTSG